MFLRKSFQEFLVLHSEAESMPAAQPARPEPSTQGEDREPPPLRHRLIDWRWLETREDAP